MAIIKCKMCGGDMELSTDKTFGTCECCGSVMTLPKLDTDQRAAQFNRGNHFRRTGEFDKALAIYEHIVQEDENDAEAHWCCALCRFGIEYVEDPATYEYLPTCHRASFDSFLEDVDYLAALEHSDGVTRRQYQKDAAKIAEVQRGILATSQNEEPFDVFICYKETDENGERTRDSLMAQDIYYQLTQEGYRVFFSRITLEDKAGTEFEPYIFAALNSAKVMVAVGTKAEHFNAVWVKNEWSRFLAIMRKDRSKLLLPCYRDMDPYDLPEQLSVLQSYDMSKIGFIQDLIRGIKKVLAKDEPKQTVKETVVVQQESGVNVAPLLKRVFMFLEDGNWQEADEYCEKVLDQDAENASAYLGKLMAELKVGKQENLKNCAQPFDGSNNYQKVLRFGDTALANEVKAANDSIVARNKEREDRRIAKLAEVRERIHPAAHLIAAGGSHTLGLKADGTVVATKYKGNPKYYSGQDNVSGWYDIVAIAVGAAHTVGLCADGTVVATGLNESGQCEVSDWRDIVAIATGNLHTVGLKADGTVVATKYKGDSRGNYGQCDVDGWEDIITIAAGPFHTVGLHADGTVVAIGYNGSGQCEVSDWRDIIAIATGGSHTVGLKADGTVIATKYTGDPEGYYGQCDVDDWRDIVTVTAGNGYSIGLRADGTVVAVGYNGSDECNTSDWRDVVAIAAGYLHTVGLCADGTVVAVGVYDEGQCDVNDWRLFNNMDTLTEECAAAMKATGERCIAEEIMAEEHRAAEEKAWQERIIAINSEKSTLNTELANLKGLFTGKRRKEIEARLEEIDTELAKLNSNGQGAMQYTCPNCGAYLTIGQSVCSNCGQEIAWE